MNANQLNSKSSIRNGRSVNNGPSRSVHHSDIHASSRSAALGRDGVGLARKSTGMGTKLHLRRVRKKALRVVRKYLSCFKPHTAYRSHKESEESRPTKEFVGTHSAPQNVKKLQKGSIKEVVCEEQPSDSIVPRELYSALNTKKKAQDESAPTQHERLVSTTRTALSTLPLLSPGAPSVSSTYSFFKDDLPRRIRSSPPVEEPAIHIEVGTVTSLRKILSEHHVLRSYLTECAENECGLPGKMAQKCASNGELEREVQGESRDGKEEGTSEETIHEKVDSRDIVSSVHIEKKSENYLSLLETPIAESCRESNLEVSVTRNSSTQFSSIVSEKNITEEIRTMSEATRSTGEKVGESSYSGSKNGNSSETSESKEISNVGFVVQGIEELREGVKLGARWLYQAFCSLCSYENEEHGGFIVI